MLSPLYGQLSPLRIPTSNPLDSDALAYIAAVETADGAALEEGVKIAINSFIVGCKSDGIWSAIKASCLLAGARTLDGALVPLVGTSAPTNNNFVSGDYNRETGLIGNTATKYLNSNHNNNATSQNSFHLSVYQKNPAFGASVNTTVRFQIGSGSGVTGSSGIGRRVTTAVIATRNRSANLTDGASGSTDMSNLFLGINRSTSGSYTWRANTATGSLSIASQTPYNGNVYIFGLNNNGALSNPTNARLCFYSIGESLNLALLDTRVSNLMTALAAAIP
jgi:hypothetical protein